MALHLLLTWHWICQFLTVRSGSLIYQKLISLFRSIRLFLLACILHQVSQQSLGLLFLSHLFIFSVKLIRVDGGLMILWGRRFKGMSQHRLIHQLLLITGVSTLSINVPLGGKPPLSLAVFQMTDQIRLHQLVHVGLFWTGVVIILVCTLNGNYQFSLFSILAGPYFCGESLLFDDLIKRLLENCRCRWGSLALLTVA